MPGSCCAPNCKSNYDVKGPRVRVYRFPRDQKKRAAWTKALARENFTPSLHTVVCEKHFVPSDFIRTSTYTDVQTGRVIEVRLERLRLKQSAVPSVFPSCPNTSRPTASTLDVHRDERTHSQDQLNNVVWEHSVYKCRSIAPAACSTKVVQADLVPPVKLTVDVAAGPSHSVCGVSSSTQAVTIKLDGGTQTCPSDFDDHPNSSVMPRLQDGGLETADIKPVFLPGQDVQGGMHPTPSKTSVVISEDSSGGKQIDKNVHQCSHCNKVFAYKKSLVEHFRIHTGERPYKCNHCGSCFARQKSLAVHVRAHTGSRPYRCNYCGANFAQWGHLHDHIRRHAGNGPYLCDHCGAGFALKGALVEHVRMHSGDRPYTCDQCSSAFAFKKHLVTHLRTHTGEKPYLCQLCPMAFAHNSTLVRHVRSHKGEKPFKCESCNKTFTRMHNYNCHKEREHKTNTVFSGV